MFLCCFSTRSEHVFYEGFVSDVPQRDPDSRCVPHFHKPSSIVVEKTCHGCGNRCIHKSSTRIGRMGMIVGVTDTHPVAGHRRWVVACKRRERRRHVTNCGVVIVVSSSSSPFFFFRKATTDCVSVRTVDVQTAWMRRAPPLRGDIRHGSVPSRRRRS